MASVETNLSLPHTNENMDNPGFVAFDEGKMIYSCMAAMGATATSAVALRLWARRERGAELKLDDWLIIASLVCIYLYYYVRPHNENVGCGLTHISL